MINTYYKIYRTYQLSNQLSLFYRNGTSLQQIVQIYRNEQDNEFLKFLGNCLLKKLIGAPVTYYINESTMFSK